jgi:adenylate cyclase
MAVEIERKFLVQDETWRAGADRGQPVRQAYLATNEKLSIRIRITDERDAALTLKSRTAGTRRQEFEYAIPVEDANELMALRSGAIVSKMRYRIACDILTWEIDVFDGENEGLVIAEVELTDEQQQFERPAWLGAEVTALERYYNASLAERPFKRWDRSETRAFGAVD